MIIYLLGAFLLSMACGFVLHPSFLISVNGKVSMIFPTDEKCTRVPFPV